MSAPVAIARACVGTRFRHQGRYPGIALDCAGLVVHVARTLGLDYRDVAAYERRPSGGRLEAALDAQPCLERADGEPQPGDVLLLRFEEDPQHLAIYAGDDMVIHAYAAVRRVAEHRLDADWRARIVRVYRWRMP